MATYKGYVQINGCLKDGTLELRKLADEKSTVVAEMSDGDELTLISDSCDGEWIKAIYQSTSGYVKTVNVAVTEGAPLYRVNVSTGTLNIRKKPATTSSSSVHFTAAKNRGLYVLKTSGDWCLVSCNIGTGWASKKYLVEDPDAVPFDYPTVNEFLERLKSFCGAGWEYGRGYSSTDKYIDCSNYPYVSRFSLGEKGASSEYGSIRNEDKGTFTDPSQLKVGMEIFQSDPNNKSTKNHMGVYAGLVRFNNGQTLHAVYQSRAVYNAKQQAIYSEKTGPNLTEMNSAWDSWAWSPYVRH